MQKYPLYSTSTPGRCTVCEDLHNWTPLVPLARALFYCCLVPWQLWNSGEESGRGPRAQAGLSRVDVVHDFFITPSLGLSFSSVFCLSSCLVVSPSIAHCLKSSFASFTSCNSKCREVMAGAPHTCRTHTGKHASMKAGPLKALRQQKQQVVVCGLIGLAGCRIIELDMSDRPVSGTKCGDEFLVALTKALIYRLFLEFCVVVYGTVKWKGRETEMECCFLFQVQQRSKVRLYPTSSVCVVGKYSLLRFIESSQHGP